MSTNRENLDRLAADVAALEPADLAEVIDLVARLRAKSAPADSELAAELYAWGDDALALELEPFEWGPEGPPPVKPIRYEPGVGFVIVGGRDA